MEPQDMAVVRLEDGERVEGPYRPSSDTETHLLASPGPITPLKTIFSIKSIDFPPFRGRNSCFAPPRGAGTRETGYVSPPMSR